MFPWSSPSPSPSTALSRSLMLNPARCPTKTPSPLFLTAARIDTDHTVGAGNMSVTGRYDSKKDCFGVDFAYAPDQNNTLHAAYTVTDEKLSSIGLETGFPFATSSTHPLRRATVDMTYAPPNDCARVKLSLRNGKHKLTSNWSLGSIGTTGIKDVSTRFELDSKISSVEGIKLGYDLMSKNAKVKYARKLDSKNKIDGEFLYLHEEGAGKKAVTVKLTHDQSRRHTFSAAFNYGVKKIAAEWEWRTDNGPWNFTAAFPFNAGPNKGDWSVKRRFEF